MRTVRVKIELDLVEGEHFNPNFKDLSKAEVSEEATKAFFGWLDSWFRSDEMTDNDIIEYIQAKVLDN